MKKEKVFHCRMQKTGPTTPVTVYFQRYLQNGTLRVAMNCAAPPWIPHSVITVNLMDAEHQDETHAYVDINNCPWAEEFLLDNNIARKTEVTRKSGFCTYPLYEFDLDSKWLEEK